VEKQAVFGQPSILTNVVETYFEVHAIGCENDIGLVYRDTSWYLAPVILGSVYIGSLDIEVQIDFH
jgi:hypothetical protein